MLRLRKSLFRYTNLASAIDIIRKNRITLLNPNTWEDRGDAFYIEAFARRFGYETVQALCFSAKPQTFHHWKVFTEGTDGVCIEFDRVKVETAIRKIGHTQLREVKYLKINEPRTLKEAIELPFVKRKSYQDEGEVRILFASKQKQKKLKTIELPIKAIRRITVSPWLPKTLADGVKLALRKSCSSIPPELVRSTMIDSQKWQSGIGHLLEP